MVAEQADTGGFTVAQANVTSQFGWAKAGRVLTICPADSARARTNSGLVFALWALG